MTPIDELRRLASSNSPNLAGIDLDDERGRHATIAGRIQAYRPGTEMRADDARLLQRSLEAIELIDSISAREYQFARSQHESRRHLAATLRNEIGLGGATTASRNQFGQAILEAIAEVRDGRSQANVELESRALSEAGSGGYGVNNQLMMPISNMKARSIVMGLPGLRTVPMNSDRMRWPRFGTATAGAIGEGVAVTAAATDLDAVDVVAQKYGSLEILTSELEEDFSSDALAAIGENLLKQLALRVDLGLLEGTGAADVVGIRNVVGATTTSLAGTPSNFVKFRTAEYELRNDNGDPVVWVMHPRTWSRLGDIKTGLASDETTLLQADPQQGARTLLGYPVAMSSQITLVEGGTSAGSWAALLDTSQLVVCERRPARIEVSRDYSFNTDSIAVRATWRGGLAALNPESISLVTDIR